ncbi:MAG: hypothetical protein SVU32_00110, partial [Candidatus Nanohaloarchaea archaeon]|nr:hypothetical protein [Candidatus Nanohaloarchaea archaeon]
MQRDGNRTVHVQVRDFAGNIQPTTQSDWVVLDRYGPNITDIAPNNNSVIRGTRYITINATDYHPSTVGVISGINTTGIFDNGTTWQQFTVNKSFDPDYTASGDQQLIARVFDTVTNMHQSYYEFLVDQHMPRFFGADPDNMTVIETEKDIEVTVYDGTTNISRVALYNGTTWMNVSSGTQSSLSHTIDPGWTSEGWHNLSAWFNDSVDHVQRETLWYYVDESPPRIKHLTLKNGSVVQPDDYLNATFTDQGKAGIFALWGNIKHHTTTVVNNTSLIKDQNYIKRQFFKKLTPGHYYRFFGWSNDTLGHYNRSIRWYLLDDASPFIQGTGPDRQYINGTENISITVS